MQDLTELIKNALSPLNIPVWFQAVPSGQYAPSQHITFIEYFDAPDFNAGDNELSHKRFIQVNVWAKTNYFSLWNEVKSFLEQAGFEYTTGWDQTYEDGDTHFNRILRFIYIDEI